MKILGPELNLLVTWLLPEEELLRGVVTDDVLSLDMRTGDVDRGCCGCSCCS